MSVEFRELDDDVACIALRSFDVDDGVEGFRAALPRLADASGTVVDVHGNRGGNTGPAMEIVAGTMPGDEGILESHPRGVRGWH